MFPYLFGIIALEYSLELGLGWTPGFYWELRLSWPGCKALSFETILFISHMNTGTVSSAALCHQSGSFLQLQNGKQHLLQTHLASPAASTLQLRAPMGVAAGHDLTGSVWCGKWCYTVKQSPPQEAISALSFKTIWTWFCLHLPLTKSSEYHFFSSQLPVFVSPPFCSFIEAAQFSPGQLTVSLFHYPSWQHFSSVQGVQPFKHRFCRLFSSNLLI